MGESNAVVSAYTYTIYWHLQQYCSHPIEKCISFFTSEHSSTPGFILHRCKN